jgi:DNA polymerase-3 subunit epsilon
MIKIFYDLETTGTDYRKHSIHQLAGIIEVDGKVVEEFDIKMAPHEKAICEPEAMHLCKVTEEQIRSYPNMFMAHTQFKRILEKYIDKFDTRCKAHMIGFNNRYFDDPFLRKHFELCEDQFIGSWFWNDTIDVLCLASQYLLDRRSQMPSFKLKRVAKELGLCVDDSDFHDALYDVRITREIYRIVTGLEVEL